MYEAFLSVRCVVVRWNSSDALRKQLTVDDDRKHRRVPAVVMSEVRCARIPHSAASTIGPLKRLCRGEDNEQESRAVSMTNEFPVLLFYYDPDFLFFLSGPL